MLSTISGIAWILFASACSTSRNTAASRAYHELTTRYNIYFNAEKSYQEILDEVESNYQEDYNQLLSLYPSMSKPDSKVSGGPFDPVIDKTGKAIKQHSISAKPRRNPTKAHSQEYRQWLQQEEFNPFMKRVWLLRGKAFLQNGNYDEALSVFSGMLNLFSYDSELTDETEIWLLRTYTDAGRLYDAEKTAYVLKSKKLKTDLQKLFTEHYTHYLITKKDFPAAIPYLIKTIDQQTNYLRKKRLQFLLGQLYIMTDEKKKAFETFGKVKGLRTPNELAKKATAWRSGKFSTDSIYLVTDSIPQEILDTLGLHPESSLSEIAEKHRDWRLRNTSVIDHTNIPNGKRKFIWKRKTKTEKIVSLENVPSGITTPEEMKPPKAMPRIRISQDSITIIKNGEVSREELKRKLEENAAKMLEQEQKTTSGKSKKELRREHEKLRKEKIRERDRLRKEQLKKREAAMKAREQERKQKIKKVQ